MTPNLDIKPDIKISVNQTFGIETEMQVDGFAKKNQYVPNLDKNYKFDRDTTLAILSGFSFNKRVLIQGYHGTGKSTHIEQVAARLNWPCVRVNLDSHISRIDKGVIMTSCKVLVTIRPLMTENDSEMWREHAFKNGKSACARGSRHLTPMFTNT